MPTTCASGRKSSKPRSRPTASCATPSAGCSATSPISASEDRVAHADMPGLERYILHRLAELDESVRKNYAEFDFKRIFAALNQFMTVDLSAFYFDVRKDALYCEPISSLTRKACLTVIDHLFRATVDLARADAVLHGGGSLAVALSGRRRLGASRTVSRDPAGLARRGAGAGLGRDPAGAPGRHRRAGDRARRTSGSARASKRRRRSTSPIRSCCGTSPPSSTASAARPAWRRSPSRRRATIVPGRGPRRAFRLDDVPGVAVEFRPASGTKCARSWKILPDVGTDPDYPDVTPRDAQALREWDAAHAAAQ